MQHAVSIPNLVGLSLENVYRHPDNDQWDFTFGTQHLSVETYWRIKNSSDTVVLGSFDYSSNAESDENVLREVGSLLDGSITKADLAASGDVSITFENGNSLQILIVSAQYEAWNFGSSN